MSLESAPPAPLDTRGEYRRLATNRNFRALWSGSLLALIGTAISQIALPILVYNLTQSASQMSLILAIQLIPRAILSPFAGVLADTFDRRRLLIVSCLVQAAAVVFLPFATELWQVAVIALIASTGASVFGPSEMASVPTLVPPDELVTALAAVQVAGSLTRIIGPAVGAGLIALSGTDLAFWVQAVLFLAAVAMFLPLVLPENLAAQSFRSATHFLSFMRDEAIAGLRTVWRVPIVRAVCATEALWSLTLAALSITTVVFVKEELDAGTRDDLYIGVLAVSLSFGAFCGAIVARRLERRLGLLTLLLVGYFAPLLLAPAALTPPLGVLLVCWFLLGFADAWLVIAMNAYVIGSVPPVMRGRVYAIWFGIISVAGLATFAISGWLTEQFGPQMTFLITGLAVSIGSPIIFLLSGAMRTLRSRPGASGMPSRAGATE
jgi:MFS transporter, DHA3 family, macrolide efflux protein